MWGQGAYPWLVEGVSVAERQFTLTLEEGEETFALQTLNALVIPVNGTVEQLTEENTIQTGDVTER
jgi:hypothetical protein